MKTKRKKTWPEIKASKTPEEWRRTNRAYRNRARDLQKLKDRGNDLLLRVSGSYYLQNAGNAETLVRMIRRAISLQKAWTPEDYDHSVTILDEVEKEIKNTVIPDEQDLLYEKTLRFMTMLAPNTPEKKLEVAYKLFHDAAIDNVLQRVDDRAENDMNFLAQFVTKPDGYYPSWFPKLVAYKLTHMLGIDDLQMVVEQCKEIVRQDRLIKAVMGEVAVHEENEVDPNEVR